MNNCVFLGKLYGDIHCQQHDKTTSADFQLEVESFRKNKNGVKNRSVTVFDFQAWDTAALTIEQRLKKDDLILVECSARKNQNSVYFRVNSFRIFNKERFSNSLED